MKKACRISKTHQSVYRFRYPFQRAFSTCLLAVLLSLPLAPAFASIDSGVEEEVSTPIDTVDTSVSEPTMTGEDSESLELEVGGESVPEFESGIQPEEDVELHLTDPTALQIADEQADAASSTDENASPVAEDAGSTEMSPDIATNTPPGNIIVDVIETEQEQVTNDMDTDVSPDETIVDENFEQEITETGVATTSEIESAPDHVVNAVTNDENRFSFSKNECTATGDGAFYCSRTSDAPTVVHADRVFSAVDVDGDKEIYMEKGGELSAITENQFDDDAPYFDEHSNTIVWHRLIDGRYQIISFDIDSEKETQLTHESYNNMEPHRDGDVIVWQAWIGNDWDIAMWDDGVVHTVTDNDVHDVMPHINSVHIIWQSFEDNIWKMKVFDTRSGAIETIENSDGGSVENPRFVLVYDTKYESGDVETRGYDLETGEVVALGATPAPVPEEIPDPDQTGEKRALVTTSVQPKSKIDGEEGDAFDPPPDDTDQGMSEGDLIIAPLATSTATGTIETIIEVGDAEPIVDIEVSATATTSVDHIDDLVIPPYVEPVTEESTGDAQISIAQES